jgi:hypothetical protein
MREFYNDLSEQNFLGHFVQNAPQLMWFLGAGTSRTAGMPTATDIIWRFKAEILLSPGKSESSNS